MGTPTSAPNRRPGLQSIPSIERIRDELSYRSFHYFVRRFWKYVDPDPFIDGWHLRAICSHLAAVSRGVIRRLIINIPPRHMKSLATSVFWPAWDWLHRPDRRWLFASYAQTLSLRDSVRCRRLLDSPPYQRMIQRLHPGFALADDQNTKSRFDTYIGGYRIASSVGGALTGEGGDIIGIDDPHNIIDGESPAMREACLLWWSEVMQTRLNDPKTGSFVIIMQRIHEQDLTGYILSSPAADQWDHLCLPARFEGDRVQSSLGFCDPRTQQGELLWPERFGEDEVKAIESSLGSYASAGQLQQRPAPREGGMFKVRMLRLVDSFNPKDVIASVRYWDKAATEGGGKRTAGTLMSRMRDGKFIVRDVLAGQWDVGHRESIIQTCAARDGRDVRVWVEQEPGSGGLESAQATIGRLAGYRAFGDKVTGSKESRAEAYAAQVEIGNVGLVRAPWNARFVDEHQAFPRGKFTDQVDSASGAFAKVSRATGGVAILP